MSRTAGTVSDHPPFLQAPPPWRADARLASGQKSPNYDVRAAKVKGVNRFPGRYIKVPTNPTRSHRARRRAQPLRVRGWGSDQLLGSVWVVRD
jgi:hypothetical protein